MPVATRVRALPLRTRPSVSVVIPCYNYGHYLADSVRSVLDQDGVDIDVTIVDDASPDGSVAIAHRLAAEDGRVRVIAHEINQGHIATYNEGLAAVSGDYVVLLSADDLLAEGCLGRATALLEAHPDVGMVYGFAPVFVDRPPPVRTNPRSWSLWSGPDWLELVCRRGSNPIYTPEVVLRTSLMRELKGYDVALPHAADFLLWLRAAARAGIGRINGVDQAFYRRHGANMHMEQFKGAVTDITERHRAFETLFDTDAAHLSRLPNVRELRELARRAMAREALVLAWQGYARGADGAGAGDLDRLVALAEQIWPASATSVYRRRCARQRARARRGRPPLVPARVNALVDQALVHVRWRRWRRSGVMGAVRSL